jgi:hypothetical protein
MGERKEFLQKFPLKKVASVAIAASSLATLLTACGEDYIKKEEFMTEAEKGIYNTVETYYEVQKFEGVDFPEAVTLAQYASEGKEKEKSILDSYNEIKNPYQGIFTENGPFANLAYVANRFNWTDEATIGLFEEARNNYFLDKNQIGSDLTALSISNGKNIKDVKEISDYLAKVSGNNKVVDILTSAALISTKENASEKYKEVGEMGSFSEDLTQAILALGSVLNDGDTEKIISSYDKIYRHKWDRSLGMRNITEDEIATLVLAANLGTYKEKEILDMYDYVRANSDIDTNTTSRLILATAANKVKRSIISREQDQAVSTGKVTIIYHEVVPLALSK